MKVSELMIGDWVFAENKPAQITSMSILGGDTIGVLQPFMSNEIVYSSNKTALERGAKDINNIKPISLTQEILEKNGFEQIRNVGHFFEDGYGKKVIYNFFCKRLKIISDYDTLLNIEYFGDINLHEFQHILKICDIDKEIVL